MRRSLILLDLSASAQGQKTPTDLYCKLLKRGWLWFGGGFAPRTFGLYDLAHLSMRVGLYGCGGQGREGGVDVFQSKT